MMQRPPSYPLFPYTTLFRSDDARMGLYFIEPGAAPRSTHVLYDRSHSAASRMEPGDYDWNVLDAARHVHLTGITPSLRDRTSTRLNSSHVEISYAVFCFKKN